ncbi:MAG TPA: imelysin family protein, partial [Cytophagales bacterium]|nr:imelysin family protein [Cytophagales bacterium]
IILLFLCCCKKEQKPTPDYQKERAALLENLSKKYISPELSTFKTKTASLVLACNYFIVQPNEITLGKLQQACDESYMQYLKLDAFRFGPFKEPAFQLTLYDYIATMPCNADFVERKIESRTFNTVDYHYSTRGFSTLDYLLFDRTDRQDTIVQKYLDDNRLYYLRRNCIYIDSMAGVFQKRWDIERATFSDDASLSVASDFTQFYNAFLQSLEFATDAKLRIPAGLSIKNIGVMEPHSVEFYYAGASKKYLMQHVTALEDIWLGRTATTTAFGINYLVAAQTQDLTLLNDINMSFSAAKAAIQELPEEGLDYAIMQGSEKIGPVHDAMSTLIKYFKVDLPSRIGVPITFSSGDGD